MRYVIDSYAWIEYFIGSQAGDVVRKIIESVGDEKLTPTICVAEIYSKVLSLEGLEAAELRRNFIKSRSALVPLTEEIAVEAAKVNVDMKKEIAGWRLADSIVLGTARKKRGKVLTGDEHFRNLKETSYIR
jgi:predicted nucleic acid-binding protein